MMRKVLSNSAFAALGLGVVLFWCAPIANAATLSLTPNTGIYSVGNTFTVHVVVDTAGKSINAADAQLSFNPRELAVVSANRTTSIFNLWTQEPTFSNVGGTVTFGGGSPTGYIGSRGTVATVTFRTLTAGPVKVNFASASVLAADGLGTNVLTTMTGGNYTVNAAQLNPEPEYIAPANTPQAPKITSSTHPDSEAWYKGTTAELAWALPSGITGVRTLLDASPSTIPTIVHDSPISSRTIENLPQGISYFHIQLRNAEGWGRVAHYRLAIDSEPPHSFELALEDGEETPSQRFLIFRVEDTSPIVRYRIQIDGGDPFEFEDIKNTRRYALPPLNPGYHTIIAEAFDSADNSRIATVSFEVHAFERPVFIDLPLRISSGVIPALKGSTRPDAAVTVTLTSRTGAIEAHELLADSDGAFIFIPNAPLQTGVYELNAIARDRFGAVSEPSDTHRLIVDEPGFIRLGSFLINALSVVVPLAALLLLFVYGSWYLWHRLSLWRRGVITETKEAESKLADEFGRIVVNLHAKVGELKQSRGGKLTRAESALIVQIEQDLADAQKKIGKEISDIDDVVQ